MRLRSAFRFFLAPLLGSFVLGCSDREPTVAPGLELERFEGRWYEIARIPREYDELCHDTIAEYAVVGPGKLEMTHSCHIGSSTGTLSHFRAPASAEDPAVPAKLTLELGLYRGAYWVLEIGKDYEYALIGHPSLTMLWVLSRAPSLDSTTWGHLLERAQGDGFSTDQLVMTPQSAAESR